jgi:hypothetical protein
VGDVARMIVVQFVRQVQICAQIRPLPISATSSSKL